MSLPDKITQARTKEDLLKVLGDYIPSEIYRNCYDAFYGIIRRAHEIGYCEGKENEKEMLRIKLGLNPIDYFGGTDGN